MYLYNLLVLARAFCHSWKNVIVWMRSCRSSLSRESHPPTRKMLLIFNSNPSLEVSVSVNILIAFYSRSGSTEVLAQSIAEGATSVGATVRLRRAREFVDAQLMKSVAGWFESATRMNSAYEAATEADAEWADAIIFGTPTRFGSVSAGCPASRELLLRRMTWRSHDFKVGGFLQFQPH
jgi:hypothetical protein